MNTCVAHQHHSGSFMGGQRLGRVKRLVSNMSKRMQRRDVEKPKSRDRSSRRIVAKGQAGCRSVDPGPEQYAARWRIDRRRLVAWVPPVAAGFNVPLDAATGVIGRPSSSFPVFSP